MRISIRSRAAAICSSAGAACGRLRDVRRRQPARPPRRPVRRALRSRDGCGRPGRSAAISRSTTFRPSASGARSKSCCCSPPRPSMGLALALELGVIDRLFPELKALVGCPQEPEWHPEGDVWVHTLLVVDQARGADRGTRASAAAGRDARRALPRSWQAADDGIPRRPHPIDGSRAGGRGAGIGLARSPQRSYNQWLRRATQVMGIVAHHLKPHAFFKVAAAGRATAHSGGWQQKVDLELLARVAISDCHGRTGTFDCSAIERFLERARALGVEHRPPEPIVKGRHLLELGVVPGPARRRSSCVGSTKSSLMVSSRRSKMASCAQRHSSGQPGRIAGTPTLKASRSGKVRLDMNGVVVAMWLGVAAVAIVLLGSSSAAAQQEREPIGRFVGRCARRPAEISRRWRHGDHAGRDSGQPAEPRARRRGRRQRLSVAHVPDRSRRRRRVAAFQQRQQVARPRDEKVARAARPSKLTSRCCPRQVSLNFGGRDGWSYVSGGIGWAQFTTELESSPVSRS